MKTQDKIKRLIEKYKNAHLRAPNNIARILFKDVVKDLKSILELECKHENVYKKGNHQTPEIDIICADCHELISSTFG